MATASAPTGTRVTFKSLTPCPVGMHPQSLIGFRLSGPGPVSFEIHNETLPAWTGGIDPYISVITDATNPMPLMVPGTYTIQPVCETSNYVVTQTYVAQTLRLTAPRQVVAVATAHRGTQIHIAGAGCPRGDNVLAGIVLASQRSYDFTDPRLSKYFGTSKVNSAGRWSVPVNISASAHLGQYRARAECSRADETVDIGYSPQQLTLVS
jgi:hypothetical protein